MPARHVTQSDDALLQHFMREICRGFAALQCKFGTLADCIGCEGADSDQLALF